MERGSSKYKCIVACRNNPVTQDYSYYVMFLWSYLFFFLRFSTYVCLIKENKHAKPYLMITDYVKLCNVKLGNVKLGNVELGK
jgi:hypothetical protein